MESYPYPVKEPWPPFCSAATQKGKGIEKLIEIITLAPTTGEDNYHTTRVN